MGKKVVAIRPLRGLRGRSENPEIHYAFKTFIYFRITYILSPGGPARTADDGPPLSGRRRQRSRGSFSAGGGSSPKVKIVTYIKEKCPVRGTAGRWLSGEVD